MTTTTLNRTEAVVANPPTDVRESLGEQILLKLALDAVQSLEPSKLNAAVTGEPTIRPQMMLTLLAYCYAARIYASQDIACASRNDPSVRYICARTVLDWRTIRQFRRNNRELVEQCLAYVLKRAWLLESNEPEGEWSAFNVVVPERTWDFAFAAQQKIEVAIIMDMPQCD